MRITRGSKEKDGPAKAFNPPDRNLRFLSLKAATKEYREKSGHSQEFFQNRALAHWIVYQMKRHDIRQDDVAARLGCTQVAISRVIHNSLTSKRIRAAVAAALNYPTWEQLAAAHRRSA